MFLIEAFFNYASHIPQMMKGEATISMIKSIFGQSLYLAER